MKSLNIKNKKLKLPIIQGGMGIGVSRSRLAGAVAKEGCMGVISAAQIGYDSTEFRKNPEAANLNALKREIKKAKEISEGNGMVAVNIMVATQNYENYVRTACLAGVDAIISGAGLPTALPEYVSNSDTMIAPIVSSEKAAKVILRYWDKHYGRTADFIVIEGPYAGGHLGFSEEQLISIDSINFDDEIRKIISLKHQYERNYNTSIPVFVAGGISDYSDVRHVLDLGADGIQVASRFVATAECDADEAFKEAYINATAEDTVIIKSPVGMPGRAVCNTFVKQVMKQPEKINYCFNCLKACNPNTAPYCITQALIRAVMGDVENGLIFCGAKVGKINEMTTVANVIAELSGGKE